MLLLLQDMGFFFKTMGGNANQRLNIYNDNQNIEKKQSNSENCVN